MARQHRHLRLLVWDDRDPPKPGPPTKRLHWTLRVSATLILLSFVAMFSMILTVVALGAVAN